MCIDLCGLPIANASLLDEGTAAAEAMSMAGAVKGDRGTASCLDQDCHPQTIAVIETRAEPSASRSSWVTPMGLRPDEDAFGALVSSTRPPTAR
jgi:glycine dehydrogenase